MIETRFKKTEVGVIPEDWKCVLLKTLVSDVFSGRNNKRSRLGRYPVYGSTGIIANTDDFRYSEPSILVARVGANAGLVNKVEGKYDVSDNTLIIPAKKEDIDFLFYQLKNRDLNKMSYGSGQPLITGTQLKNLYVISIDDKSEQNRIAAAFSDIDALISDLEALIEKKQNIKQGVMQELLSGKRRLAGFTGKWEKKPFFEVLYSCNNKSKQIEQNQYLESGITPIVDQGKQLIGGYTDKVDPIKKETGPYIVFGDHTCFFKYVDFDFYLGADGTQLLKCYKDYNTAYINYACQMIALPNTGYDRHFKYLRDAVFFLPSLKAEQNSIAKVLMTMDSEKIGRAHV